jgi:nicotinamide mononucleotide transporter
MVVAVIAALRAISALEWFAVFIALAYLLLAIRQNPWCWVCSIVSSVLFIVLFARAGLVMQCWLQVFYIAMAAYGFWAWRAGDGRERPLTVSRWNRRYHLPAVATIALIAAVNARLSGGVLTLSAYADALTTWASVFATWLLARKVIDNWIYWIFTDLIAAGLYWSQGLYATAVLFVLYSGLAWRAWREWQGDLRSRAGRVPAGG